MNDFFTGNAMEKMVAKDDRCYHKLYGFGEVLDVYRDENNRNIVQCRFSSGFQYFNYQYFTEIMTVFPKEETFPLCPICGNHPTTEAGTPCLDCQKKAETSSAKKKAPVKKEVQGYFSDEEEGEDDAREYYDAAAESLDFGGDDEDDDEENEEEKFLQHGFSFGDFNR